MNGIGATGAALADAFEAVVTFDLVGLVNAVVNIPARILDGVLNGGYWEDTSGPAAGLLSPNDAGPMGPIALWTAVSQEIGYLLRSHSPGETSAPAADPSKTGPATSTAVTDPSADQGSSDALTEMPDQGQQPIDTDTAEAADGDDTLSGIDTSLGDDADIGESLPADAEELIGTLEVAVSEDAAGELTDEPESPASQGAGDPADPADDNAEGGMGEPSGSSSTGG